jgi:hypothetical protein
MIENTYYSVATINTNLTIYTVPTGKEAIINITVNNHATTASTYKIATVPNGGSISNANTMALKTLKAAGDNESTHQITGKLLNAGDTIRINANSLNVSVMIEAMLQNTSV